MSVAAFEPGTLGTRGGRPHTPLGQSGIHGRCTKNAMCTALFCPPSFESRTFSAVLLKKTKSLIDSLQAQDLNEIAKAIDQDGFLTFVAKLLEVRTCSFDNFSKKPKL